MCSSTAAMDWPLSRAEKRHQVLQLYDREQLMTDSVVMSGQAALARMKDEIEAIKNRSKILVGEQQGLSEDSQRLWQALETVSGVFRAVVPPTEEDDDSGDEPLTPQLQPTRSKSAPHLRDGALPSTVTPLVPIRATSNLPRTPRSSLTGKQEGGEQIKRKVSFSGEPEGSRRTSVCEPDPEDSLPMSEPAKQNPVRTSEAVSKPVIKISEWGLTEFCAPREAMKLGMQFKKLPPAPLIILKVTEGSWAEEQGICRGDVLHSVAGKFAEDLSHEQFIRLIMARPLKVTIQRDGHF